MLSAVALLAQRGYQGTSFSEVLVHSGAPRGSVYYHFPGGKDELVAAALWRTVEIAAASLDDMRGLPLRQMVQAFCGWWRAILDESSCERGCPLVAVSSGASEESPLQGVVRDAFIVWEKAVADVLRSAPEVEAAGVETEDAAVYLLGALEGALSYGRATKSLERFDVLAASISASVPALLGL